MLKSRERSGPVGLRRARQALAPFPGQALALALLMAVLAAVVVSAPLMLSSSAQGAWEQRQAQVGQSLGTTLLSGTGSPTGESSVGRLAGVPELDGLVRDAGADLGLADPELTTITASSVTAAGPSGSSPGVVVSRPGYQTQVELVAGEATDEGVLVSELFVERTGVAPGDTVQVQVPGDELTGSAASATAEVNVSGVYADVSAPAPDFWQGIADLAVPREDPATGAVVVPDPVLLTSLETSLELEQAVEIDAFLSWYFPAPRDLLVPAARELSQGSQALLTRVVAPGQPVADLVEDAGYVSPTGRTALPSVLDDVDATVDLLSPPVRAVGVGGALAALALVGAWAGARARRRENELRALIARGLSPARGGAQAAAETAVPVLVGLVAGGALGWGAVVALGPSPRLPTDAVAPAVAVLVAAGLVAVLVVAVVTASAVARLGRVGLGPAAQLAGRIPWLPVLAAVTVVVAAPLVVRGVSGDAGQTGRVDVLTLLVPLLAVVVVTGAVVALLQRLAPRLAGRVRRLPPAGFLAARRVLTGPGATRLVVVTTALALGLVTYAGALADSTTRTIAAKASVATGSDVVVELGNNRVLPEALTADGGSLEQSTEVGLDSGVSITPGDVEADVLVVDPAQLPDVVRWNEALADQPLDDLMAALSDGEVQGRVPVIAAGDLPTRPVEAVDGQVTIDLGGYQVPAQVVARADAFPGQSSLRPLLVAPWEAYSAAITDAGRDPETTIGRQVWARGDATEVTDVLATSQFAASVPETAVRTAADFRTRPALVAQTWSLGYLRAVALAAGLLGLVGLVLHAAAQARARTVAVLLAARMGMSTRATAAAAALETGILAVLAAVVAVAVTLPASVLVLGLLDPVPDLPPDPLVAIPWATIALVVAGAVAVAAAAGALAARTARTASPGQVMRDAD